MPAIEITEEEGGLQLSFCPGDPSVIQHALKILDQNGTYNFSRTLSLKQRDLITEIQKPEEEIYSLTFKFGSKESGYFKIGKEILGTKFDVYFESSYVPDVSDFVADKNISIFSPIDSFNEADVYIGGKEESAIPLDVFHTLIKKFPNTTEKKKYVRARIWSIVKEYFVANKDPQEDYERYLDKKHPASKSNPNLNFSGYETQKFDDLYDKLDHMLEHYEDFSETQWQKEIIHILVLLFPRYIKAIREVKLKDRLRGKNRFIDYLLIDASGFVDVVEIKKPEFNSLITERRSGRDNFIAVRKLNDAVMQTENIYFILLDWVKMVRMI